MTPRPPKLFVGVGNILKRDDGVGVEAARRLAEFPLPRDIEVYDAGTVGLDAAAVLENRQLVVVVDGVDAGAEPGALFRFKPKQLRPGVKTTLSLHDVHLLDALDETRLLGMAPADVIIFGVQVGDLSTGIGLSPAVEKSLLKVLHLASRSLGMNFERLQARSTSLAF